MGARKQFPPEFKREAVQLIESGSCLALRSLVSSGCPESTLQVANLTTGAWEYGLSRSWRSQGTDDGSRPAEARTGSGHRSQLRWSWSKRRGKVTPTLL